MVNYNSYSKCTSALYLRFVKILPKLNGGIGCEGPPGYGNLGGIPGYCLGRWPR